MFDLGSVMPVDDKPTGIAKELVQRQPTPEPEPEPEPEPVFNPPPVSRPFAMSKNRPRRGTFGSGDAPTLDGDSEDEFHGRRRYRYQDDEREYEYGRWR
jgi:hypothetical protein